MSRQRSRILNEPCKFAWGKNTSSQKINGKYLNYVMEVTIFPEYARIKLAFPDSRASTKNRTFYCLFLFLQPGMHAIEIFTGNDLSKRTEAKSFKKTQTNKLCFRQNSEQQVSQLAEGRLTVLLTTQARNSPNSCTSIPN